ncbi:hypothetical protein LNAOJCKE_1822 [Methylorubrum aminovorans]|uniref:Uncharacterized protein n=2 Tax=Methylorubrum aminovorans TaxID=269069 RepID=A0ABQ4UBB6_9HYPH|nr:hypothetical protein LNAOJCKE_1822 [Methylorubrum aminovorans]GMA75917.1 hypothetical protein GCM10025880_23340 [Methylorubrum aminovorans]
MSPMRRTVPIIALAAAWMAIAPATIPTARAQDEAPAESEAVPEAPKSKPKPKPKPRPKPKPEAKPEAKPDATPAASAPADAKAVDTKPAAVPAAAAPAADPAPVAVPPPAATNFAAPPVVCEPDQAVRYQGAKNLDLWVTRSGTITIDNPLRPLTPDVTRVLQVVLAGKVATAYGPDLLSLRRGGSPATLEGTIGGKIQWNPSLVALPDSLPINAETGEPLAELRFRECGTAPSGKLLPPPKARRMAPTPEAVAAEAEKAEKAAKAAAREAAKAAGVKPPPGAPPPRAPGSALPQGAIP